jgi:structural maintenance of chromosome 4
MWMQDDEQFEVIQGSEFAVSRTATRDNKSDYYINDRRSNFTEVTSVLKGKGIDLDNNRFLILQGEVEQISMMKPKGQAEHDTGLLEYLEDIIGTDKYIPMIEEGSKRLEELNERRQGMVQRVKIAERERNGLEAEKMAAEAYMSKELESLEAQSMLAQVFVKDAQYNVGKIEANIGTLDEKLSHEKAKCAEFNAALEVHERRYNTVAAEHASIQRELEAATGEFKEFERKDIKYREDLKHLKSKLKKVEDKSAKDAAKLSAVEAEGAALEAAVPELRAKAEAAQAKLGPSEEVLEGMLEGIKGEVEGLRGKLRGVRADLAPWQKQMTEVNSRIDVATSERDLLEKEHADAASRLETAKAELQAETEAAATKSQQASEMEGQIDKLRTQRDSAVAREESIAAQIERLTAATREVRGKTEQRRAEASQKASASAVVSALLEAKSSGAIEGIHGRLGDLGAIDARYDVAVSTACPALDYIVVETTSAAQRCVELLRRQQRGVATFLILEKQAHLAKALKEKVSPPEGCPRLFDLVRCSDERLRLAFYYAMRDTLVANDLDQASRIAYSGDKRWRRVVTLKGEMINETGTMSGGGSKPRGGRLLLGNAAPRTANGKDAAVELREVEKELESAVNALKDAREAFTEAQAEVRAARLALQDIETAIPKLQLEASAASDRAADLKAGMAQLEAATKVSPEHAARLKSLEADIAGDEKELASLRKKSEGLMRKAEELEKAIADAGGENVKRQRALVAQLQQEIDAAEAEATKSQVRAEAAKKQAEKLRKEVTKCCTDKEKLVAQLESKTADFKALEDAAFKVMEVVQATQGVLAGKEAELATIRGEFEERQREVSIVRQVEVDISAELDVQRTALQEESKKAKQWAAKVAAHASALQARTGVAPTPMTEDELQKASAQELQYRVSVLEEEMARMNINLEAIEAWRAADTEYAQRITELEATSQERDAVRREHEELRKRRLDEFMAGFNTISLKLKEMYRTLTLGGDAELELVDTLDPFSEGILFSVRPPKKSWKNIANLSGGEKTLSSLSLVFALHHYKPTPLYVMDEIDAALDFKNVSIIGHYIKERTKNAQFVIISLRNQCFELADRLVGIYKTDNATKTVCINPGEFAVGAGAVPKKAGLCTADGDSKLDQEQQAVAAVPAT